VPLRLVLSEVCLGTSHSERITGNSEATVNQELKRMFVYLKALGAFVIG
jgi:hypothetical protein